MSRSPNVGFERPTPPFSSGSSIPHHETNPSEVGWGYRRVMTTVVERMEKMMSKFDITGQGTILDVQSNAGNGFKTPPAPMPSPRIAPAVASAPASESDTASMSCLGGGDEVNGGRRGRRYVGQLPREGDVTRAVVGTDAICAPQHSSSCLPQETKPQAAAEACAHGERGARDYH